MRLLLIEDDVDLSLTLALFLKATGYALDTARDGERGYFLAQTNDYDIIISDYNLPLLSGREIIGRLRAENIGTPIIILTVRSETKDKIELLNLGADDYLTKPFSSLELSARIKSLLRRPKGWLATLKCRDLEMDSDRYLVTKNGQQIYLSQKEFSLLEYLMKNKGRVLTRQEIMEHTWDENADPFSNTIEVHIMNLRKKIETKDDRFIFTFSGRGYKLDEKK